MEFKGTKGNWNVGETYGFNDHEPNYITPIENDQKEIAAVWGDRINSDEMKANAKLISQAPKMFEMLKLISEKAEEIYHEADGEDNRFFDEIDFEELDNLIKEATEI